MPEYPEVCYVLDALGLVESDFDYVKANPTLYLHKGIVQMNGEMVHVYWYIGMCSD